MLKLGLDGLLHNKHFTHTQRHLRYTSDPHTPVSSSPPSEPSLSPLLLSYEQQEPQRSASTKFKSTSLDEFNTHWFPGHLVWLRRAWPWPNYHILLPMFVFLNQTIISNMAELTCHPRLSLPHTLRQAGTSWLGQEGVG